MRSASSPPITVMAVASAVAVANLYYNQPMLADMARTFSVSAHEIGLAATATQAGYAAGMPLFVPLGDSVERRRLVTVLFLLVAGSLVGAAVSPNLTVLVRSGSSARCVRRVLSSRRSLKLAQPQ